MTEKTRKTRTKKTVSFAEFKAWLEGIEEMQGANWTPSAEQWKKIKTKLKTVEDQPPQPQPQPQPTHVSYQPASTLPIGFQPAPDVPSSIPNNPLVNGAPSAMVPEATPNGTDDSDAPFTSSQFS